MKLDAGRVIDRYVVERPLGEGGMASVFLVRHTVLDRRFALKVLNMGGATLRARLLEEGRIQARLEHPNIVSVTDVIEIDGILALLMQYVEGPTLAAALAGGPLPEREAAGVFEGVLAGVGFAHRHRRVHRDLKPSNVLLARVDGALVPRVADFGIAKALDEGGGGTTVTRSGLPMGTPAYMAPEQIRSARDVDHRADLFSLGCVLYEICTGVRAFPHSDVVELFGAVAGGRHPFTNPSRAGEYALIDPRVRDAVAACLAPDPRDRVASCAALRVLLRGWLPAVDRGPEDSATVGAWVPGLDPPGPDTIAAGIEAAAFGPLAGVASDGGPRSAGGSVVAPPTPSARRLLRPVAGVMAATTVVAVAWGWARIGTGVDQDALAELASAAGAPPPDEGAIPTTNPTASAGALGAGSDAPAALAVPAQAEPAVAAATTMPAMRAPSRSSSSSVAASGSASSSSSAPPASAPEPAAVAPPATSGAFSVSGGARSVYLQGAAGRFREGEEVPAGEYAIYALFDGDRFVDAGRARIEVGATLSLACDLAFTTCNAAGR